MASRRAVTTRDRQRNCTARKRSHKEGLERAKQQAAVIQKLLKQAKAETEAQAG